MDNASSKDLLEFLEDLPPVPENFSPKYGEKWGRDQSDVLFNRMSCDREFLQLLIWEATAPKTIDISNICCLFSRYNCWTFFERCDISFWRSSHLMGIPNDEISEYFPIMDLRYTFGKKTFEKLINQYKNSSGSNFLLQDFCDLCAQFNIDNAKRRDQKFRHELEKSIDKRLLITFDKKTDLGIRQKTECKVERFKMELDEPETSLMNHKNENKDLDKTGDDNDFGDADLAKSLQECFATDPEDEEELKKENGDHIDKDQKNDSHLTRSASKRTSSGVGESRENGGVVSAKIARMSLKRLDAARKQALEMSRKMVEEKSTKSATSASKSKNNNPDILPKRRPQRRQKQKQKLPDFVYAEELNSTAKPGSKQLNGTTSNLNGNVKNGVKKANFNLVGKTTTLTGRSKKSSIAKVHATLKKQTSKSEMEEIEQSSKDCDEEKESEKEPDCILEIPAFSGEDLAAFSNEEDPYITYALTFGCCDRKLDRMQRLRNLLDKQIQICSKSKKITTPTSTTITTMEEKDQTETPDEMPIDKLRQLMAFFAPKQSEYNPDMLRGLSDAGLLAIDLTNFARACEVEFAKIIEESKIHVRQKYDLQMRRYHSLLIKMIGAYQPMNNILEKGAEFQETASLLTLERSISQQMRKREEIQETLSSKADFLPTLNEENKPKENEACGEDEEDDPEIEMVEEVPKNRRMSTAREEVTIAD